MFEADERCIVIVNEELQYSIWPSGRAIPGGWRQEGVEGSKEECLAQIRTLWVDMRPASIRER
jgi:MbtH protein